MRPCPRCKRNLVESGLCSVCQAKRDKAQAQQAKRYDQERGSSTARGYDRRWRNYRTTYLHENPLCVKCMERGKTRQATEVDHIKPVINGQDDPLFWERSNHQGLCKPCHSRKTKKENPGSGPFD